MYSTKIIVVACFISCSLQGSIEMRRADGDTETPFEDATKPLFEASAKSDSFRVYEGLPHPFEGKEFVENEIRNQPTIVIDGEKFYLPARPMPLEDKASLLRLFGADLFKPWRAYKFCGGFHADYAVNFETGGRSWLVLLCFGCHEARILRQPSTDSNPQAEPKLRLTVDLTDTGYKELKELFRKYRVLRPPTPDPKTKQKAKPPSPPPVPVRL
jgi:hypothetical protein